MKRMKNLFGVLSVAWLVLSACGGQRDYLTVPNDPTETRIYTLDNGLKVYLSVNKDAPRIQAHIAVRTGSKNDPAETTGLAHYFEHLMFKGTTDFGTSDYAAEKPYLDKIRDLYEEYRTLTDENQRRAKYHEIDSISQLAAQYNIPNEYDKLMAAIGARGTNAYTSNDVTCYTEDIPSNEVENWAKIQSNRFQHIVIRGFHTELETVFEEKNMSLASDGRKVNAAMMKLLMPTHPYGTQTTLGTQEHLKNPSIINIENYYKKYYVPNNMAICMSGDFKPEEVIAIIRKYFGEMPKAENFQAPTFAPMAELTTPQDTVVYGQELESVRLAWRFKGAADLQNDTLALLSRVLYNDKAGLMDLNLNAKMKVVSSFAYPWNLADYSAFVMNAQPLAGQDLDEVKHLLLGQVEALKKGDFDEELLVSTVNNMKLEYYQMLEQNEGRVSLMVDAFVEGQTWADMLGRLERISKLQKQDVVDFANKHLTEGYVCVYKRQGEDKSIKKIDKPAITPIPANRDKRSAFLAAISDAEAAPIEPQFVDFQKDLSFGQTANNLPVIYKQNTTNGLFSLKFRYDFGMTADRRLETAASYLKLLGTQQKTLEEVQKQFYKLACDFDIYAGDDYMYISVSGLDENLPEALALTEELLNEAKVDEEAYRGYVAKTLKERENAKTNQSVCGSYLRMYGLYGPENPYTCMLSAKELQQTNPQDYLDLLKSLSKYEHTVTYYGPRTMDDLKTVLADKHKVAEAFLPLPQNKHFTYAETKQSEVFIAPYNAKNIILWLNHNENRPWHEDEQAVQYLFNNYFGGSMNGVVFQEMREARGLAYSAFGTYARPSKQGDPEYSYFYIASQNDKMMDCISTFREIIDTVPASQKAFDVAKQQVIKDLASARTTKEKVIDRYIGAKRLGIDYDIQARIYETVKDVTLDDIVNFERKTMAGKPYRYLILGNEKELDMKALEKIGPVHRLTLEDIFGY